MRLCQDRHRTRLGPFRSAPRSAQPGKRGNLRPIRWQASDAPPLGSLPRPPRDGNWTGTAVVAAIVLTGVIGGAGTVLTLESLGAPEFALGIAPVSPMATGASDAERSGVAMVPAVGMMATAPVSASGVEIVVAGDGRNGLAPAEAEPLRSSAQIIPLPQLASTGGELAADQRWRQRGYGRHRRDRQPRRQRPLLQGCAPGGVAVDEPSADPVDVTADGSDSLAAPPPRAPTPRPDRDAAPPERCARQRSGGRFGRSRREGGRRQRQSQTGSNSTEGMGCTDSLVSGADVQSRADGKSPIVAVLPAGSTSPS